MKILITVLISSFLFGCAAAPLLVVEGARAISHSSQTRFKDVEIVYRQGYDKNSIKQIKSASFLVSEGGANFFSPGAGTTLADNLAKEFLLSGLNVEEYTTLETLVNQNKLGLDTSSILVAAELADIDAVFTGSVETGQDFNMGIFGVGAGMEQGITGATLKLIDVKTKKVILIMSANYKKPKSSKNVASDMSGAFFNEGQTTKSN